MSLSIVPLYAALLAPVFVFLSVRTIKMRRRERVAIGDGNELALQKAIRVHANFAEYTPLVLIMLSFVEWFYLSPTWLHGLCGLFLLGRLSHAYGVSQLSENYKFRVSGMAATFFVLLSSSGLILFHCFIRG